jgi:hypothetical protein
MIRTCDGTDPNLLDSGLRTAGPCACGLTFDDVDRSVIHPHVFIPTADDKAALAEALLTVDVDTVWTQAELDACRERGRARLATMTALGCID